MICKTLRNVRQFLAVVAIGISVSSCGGGNQSSVPASPTGATSAGKGVGTLHFTLAVPKAVPKSTSAGRHLTYISASTQSLTIAIDGATPSTVNVTPSSPNCTPGSGNVALSCSIAQATPAGSHSVAIVTYDQQNAAGNVLSQNTVTVSIATGQVDNIPIVLGGVVASIALALASPQLSFGIPSAVGLSVNAYDADQNLILGPGTYQSPVSISDSDTSGTTALWVTDNGPATNEGASATVLDSSAQVVVRYNGKNISSATFTASAGSIQANGPAVLAFIASIQHIVVIVQENRTPDNLFNGLPGADTVTSGTNSLGQTVALQPINLKTQWDLGHFHQSYSLEWNNGAMNGWDLNSALCGLPYPNCSSPPEPAFGYVPQSNAQPYWTMAETYAFADRMFQTNEGPSFPAHMYLVAGTSAISLGNSLYAMDNPVTPTGAGAPAGCDAPSGTVVSLINPATNDQTQTAYPCFDGFTIYDLLDAAGVSWKWYQPKFGTANGAGLWYTPDAFTHIRYGPDYANVSTPATKTFFSDVTAGKLPGVSWVIPTAASSDHPSITDGSGPAWVASVVNAIGNSQYWNHTVIFVVWDDWGGWFDHVAPAHQYNYYELGFRVPLIAISPFAKTGYVSHVQHEFGSILKFTEETFGLGSLNTTDVRADDLSDMFNFNQVPVPYNPIKTQSLTSKEQNDTDIPDND